MKRVLIARVTVYLTVATALFLISCKKEKAGSSDTGGSAATGTFSVALNGKTVGGTDKLNTAIVIIAADSTSSGGLLSDVFLSLQVSGDTIGFHIPDRTGVTSIGAVNSPAQYYGVFSAPDEVYLFDSVSVNVSSETSNRIKGTFSGHLNTSLVEGEGDQADITAGTFDLPLLRP